MLHWISAVLFFILGLLVYFGMPGFSFTALILFGVGSVIACYRLLELFSRRHRKAARVLRGILTVCLCLGVIASAVTGWIIADAARGINEDCEYVVVLGARGQRNQTLPDSPEPAERRLRLSDEPPGRGVRCLRRSGARRGYF